MALRLLFLVVLAVLAFKWITGRWPWQRTLSARQQAIANARKILGVSANANRTEINSAHKRLVSMVHPDRGGTNQQVHEANDARDVLLNELPPENPGA